MGMRKGRYVLYLILAAVAFCVLLPVFYTGFVSANEVSVIYYTRAYAFFYGAFFFLFGMVQFGMSLYMFLAFSGSLRVFFSALISIDGGIFVLSGAGLFTIITNDTILNRRLFFVSAALMPFLILSVVFVVLRLHRRFKMKREGLGKQAALSDLVLLIGTGVLAAGFLMDMAYYFVNKTPDVNGLFYSGMNPTMIGLALYCASLLQSYFFLAADYREETVRHTKLLHVAYTDPLTGLDNRTRCEQRMRELNSEKQAYYIINYDVNGLKFINDSRGHADGDRYLKGFAQILKLFYKEAALIGRMGGDEFMVVLKDVTAAQGLDRAESFELMLHRLNRVEDAEFQYEAAYGCAHSTEVRTRRSADVYALADDRMYHKKRLAHDRIVGGIPDRE